MTVIEQTRSTDRPRHWLGAPNRFERRAWTPPHTLPATHRRAEQLLPGDYVSVEGERLTVAEVHPTPNLVMLGFVGLPEYGLTLRREALVCVLRLA